MKTPSVILQLLQRQRASNNVISNTHVVAAAAAICAANVALPLHPLWWISSALKRSFPMPPKRPPYVGATIAVADNGDDVAVATVFVARMAAAVR